MVPLATREETQETAGLKLVLFHQGSSLTSGRSSAQNIRVDYTRLHPHHKEHWSVF